MSTQQIPVSIQARVRTPAPAAYVVGRDPHGFWVAVETHGRAGGFFSSRDAAAGCAAFETEHRPGAVQVISGPVTLRI